MRPSFGPALVPIAAIAALSAACAAGCKDEGSAAPAPAASATASAKPALGPVDACIAVMEREALTPSNAPGKGGRISRACAAVYKEPACRKAHEDFDVPEVTARAVTLARACASAYCPKIPDPKPKLCTAELEAMPPTELGAGWFDLRTAIWKLDLGEEEAKRLERETLRIGAMQR